jgi:Fe-S-cluster containining protein
MTWICKQNCGECCGIVPFEREMYHSAVAEGLLQAIPKKYHEAKISESHTTVLVLVETDDGLCVFLNRKSKTCAVYSRRPSVCKMYGQVTGLLCLYFDVAGNPRSEKDSRRVQRFIDNQVDSGLLKIKAKVPA